MQTRGSKSSFKYLNDSEYFCLIKVQRNIYGIYDKASYLYNEKRKDFELVEDNLGIKIFINHTEVEYEIFSII